MLFHRYLSYYLLRWLTNNYIGWTYSAVGMTKDVNIIGKCSRNYLGYNYTLFTYLGYALKPKTHVHWQSFFAKLPVPVTDNM